jgi:tetratricopeptide (TPR) repeat protein
MGAIIAKLTANVNGFFWKNALFLRIGAKIDFFPAVEPACSCLQRLMPVDRRKPKAPEQGPWLPVLLFCLVMGTFLSCLQNGFVNLDDPSYASHNPHVENGLTWESVRWAWSNTESSNWHPLTWMSHLLDGQLYGLNPKGHHATSVLLHAANTVLLFLLLQRMTGARWRSFLVAALFGVHPLRVESVAWASERKDVLSAFFWLLTTWAYARYAKAFSFQLSAFRFFYALSLVFFVLGLLSKSMLVTLPFVLLLLDYWPLGRWGQTPARRLLLEKVPFLILAAASSAVTFVVQQKSGSVTPADAMPVPLRLANAVVSYLRYLGKTAWPVDLCAMYPHPGHWPALTVTAAGLFLVIITALALWQWRAMPFLAVGWFWFLGTLVPVIGLVQIGRQALADRYSYIPSIGLFMALIWSLDKLTERWRNREAFAWAAGAASILVCIPLTVRQIGYWKDSKTLFSHALKVNQRDWIDTAYLATEFQRDGQLDEAIALYEQSVQINPYHSEVRSKLAGILMERRRFDEALAQFQKGVALDPNDFEMNQGLGAVLQDMGRLDEAIAQFNQALRLKPDDADTYSNLGNCYGLKGHPDDAIRCLAEAVKLKPQSAQNHRELGVGLIRGGRWDEAINQFQTALQLDPSDAQSRRYLEEAKAAKPAATH